MRMTPYPVYNHVGRKNALEIVAAAGGLEARRYVVYSRVEHGLDVVSADVAEVAVETLRLPLPREVARSWLLLYFEDLAPAEARTALDLMTRPVDPLGDLA